MTSAASFWLLGLDLGLAHDLAPNPDLQSSATEVIGVGLQIFSSLRFSTQEVKAPMAMGFLGQQPSAGMSK